MRRLVDEALGDPAINRAAIEITRHTPQHDQWSALAAIYQWVLASIRYVPDPAGKEVLRRARDILELRAGDCDDINGVLLPALAGSIGIPTRVVTITASPYAQDFEHIYAEALVDGQWIALDAARPDAQFGRAPEVSYRKRVWDLTDGSFLDLAGGALLGQYPYAQQVPEGVQYAGTIVEGVSDIIRAWQGQPDYGDYNAPLYRAPGVVPTSSYGTINDLWPWVIGIGVALFFFGGKK